MKDYRAFSDGDRAMYDPNTRNATVAQAIAGNVFIEAVKLLEKDNFSCSCQEDYICPDCR